MNLSPIKIKYNINVIFFKLILELIIKIILHSLNSTVGSVKRGGQIRIWPV